MDASNKRVVILGKTGAGKSSLGNTIFGETLFKINHTAKSETRICQAENRSVDGRRLTVIDTPGLFDTNVSEKDLKPEIIKCITECAPGPHAFLILLKVEKFSEHEKAVIAKIEEYLSEEAFKYATVVFTHGDQLPEGQTIEDFVGEEENLRELVRKCGGRCHVIDNRYWKEKPTNEYRSNKFQVKQLLKTIDKMIEDNKDGCYTNEMLQVVEEEIQQESERIRQLPGNMSEDEINKRAKKSVSDQLLITLAGIGTGVLLGAFFGVKSMMKVVLKALKEVGKVGKEIMPIVKDGKELIIGGERGIAAVVVVGGGGEIVAGAAGAAARASTGGGATAAGGGAAVAAATGALKVAAVGVGASALVGGCVGGYEGFKASEKAETVWEAVEMAKEAVTEGGTRLCDKIDNFGKNSKQNKN